ncbi:hypothetical protein OJF2_35820 [Aquisphaera giovannonii]|uniref:Ice-binding protein C-terminal domain-containing protein n=1 Tax=Aquisphaera giovannonii TaxID=406548 RepID=A0A5B9W463_9BACT|nr:PEP-CTERM sorting domain-containing protein [Aquisphaera giovannonii]QEH35037.1 hypothetical protein OJF2_35820 [Aquisphaera giovannonii]
MRKFVSCLATAILLSGACRIQAGTLLDFNMDSTHPAGASIRYAGGAAPLVGVNLSVDSVTGLDASQNDGSMLSLAGGLLNFQTGNLISSDASHWAFGAGGSISITTTSPILPGASDLLLSGTLKSVDVELGSGVFKVVIASYVNTVDSTLASYFGVAPGSSWEGDLNLSFRAKGLPPGGFESSRILSGDVTTGAVPEPSSVLMGGIGVLGLGLLKLRRRGR